MEITIHIDKVKLTQCVLYLYYHYNTAKNTASIKGIVNNIIDNLMEVTEVDNLHVLLETICEILPEVIDINLKNTNFRFGYKNNYILCYIEPDTSLVSTNDSIVDTITMNTGIFASYLNFNTVKVEIE